LPAQVSSRREQKERLRAEREAKERADAQAARRRRLTQVIGAVGGVVIIAVVVVVIAVASGGGGGSSGGSTAYSKGSVPSGAEVGVTTKPPPWPPNYSHLAQRLQAMNLPQLNEQVFHIHAMLRVYVNGKQVTVPPNIGLDQATQTFSPIHTHPDIPGVIHEEAAKEFDFTLGQFFTVWGVKFSNDQLGPYKPGNGNVLQVYDNGQRVTDPENVVLQSHHLFTVGYGKPGSFPTSYSFNWPTGL
jgi:hypothetical protein